MINSTNKPHTYAETEQPASQAAYSSVQAQMKYQSHSYVRMNPNEFPTAAASTQDCDHHVQRQFYTETSLTQKNQVPQLHSITPNLSLPKDELLQFYQTHMASQPDQIPFNCPKMQSQHVIPNMAFLIQKFLSQQQTTSCLNAVSSLQQERIQESQPIHYFQQLQMPQTPQIHHHFGLSEPLQQISHTKQPLYVAEKACQPLNYNVIPPKMHENCIFSGEVVFRPVLLRPPYACQPKPMRSQHHLITPEQLISSNDMVQSIVQPKIKSAQFIRSRASCHQLTERKSVSPDGLIHQPKKSFSSSQFPQTMAVLNEARPHFNNLACLLPQLQQTQPNHVDPYQPLCLGYQSPELASKLNEELSQSKNQVSEEVDDECSPEVSDKQASDTAFIKNFDGIPSAWHETIKVRNQETKRTKLYFRCRYQECKSVFRKSCNLRDHFRKHTMARPYQCEICFKNFTQSGNLGRHLKNVHMIARTVPRLEKCNKFQIAKQKGAARQSNPSSSEGLI